MSFWAYFTSVEPLVQQNDVAHMGLMLSYNRSMLIRWIRHVVMDPVAMNGMIKKEATSVRALKELKVKIHLRCYKPVITKFIYEYGLSFTLCLCRHAVYWKYVVFTFYTGSSTSFDNMLSAERQLN
jgi:hypothetical protein